VDNNRDTLMDMFGIVDEPLATLPESRVRPPKEMLDQVMEELR
jgi:2-oxoglutarate ferredoxin oxidoreductase subunit beta